MKLKRKKILRKILGKKVLANYCNFFTWIRYKALIRMCYEWIGLTKEYEECLMGEAKIFIVQQQINTLTNKSFLDCLSIPLCLCVQLSLCLFVTLSFCFSVFLFFCLSVSLCQSVYLLFFCFFLFFSLCLFVLLSCWLSICLSAFFWSIIR